MLRRFGYSDALEFKPAAQAALPASLAADSSVELSAAGEAFLQTFYRQHARAQDGLLPVAALAKYVDGHSVAGQPAATLLPPFTEDASAVVPDTISLTLPVFLGAWRYLY